MVVVGKKLLAIEFKKGNQYFRLDVPKTLRIKIMGDTDGTVYLKGPSTDSIRIAGRITAMEYSHVEKAKSENLKNPYLPWRHEFKVPVYMENKTSNISKIYTPSGKRLWDYR